MSFYNMLRGFNSDCVLILPMLGRKLEEYPRFRDCFVTEDGNIAIFTRVGGGNRDRGYGEEVLYEDENFLRTYDDDFDCTYGTYEFKVPERWKSDFGLILDGKQNEVSREYIDCVKSFYPKLAEQGVIDWLFSQITDGDVESEDTE